MLEFEQMNDDLNEITNRLKSIRDQLELKVAELRKMRGAVASLKKGELLQAIEDIERAMIMTEQ
jgi:tetrahydromethanopterin S-methyltransferase subunit G